MKYLLPAILLFSACNTVPGITTPVEENNDSILTKEKATQELKKLRGAVTDSGFAFLMDAGLQIQKVEFALQKADSSRIKKGFSDMLINDRDGELLYACMMKVCRLALEHSHKTDDINYYKSQLSISQKEWLRSKFQGKKTYEALISVFLIQKEVAIISMIVNGADTKENRKQVEKQYSGSIENMTKAYLSKQ